MSDERYGVYIWGTDQLGPWDPQFYGPYESYEAAKEAADKFREKVKVDYADYPYGEWDAGADIIEMYDAIPGDQIMSGIESDADKLKQVKEEIKFPTEH